eukprot:TRINITY_DN2050_c2_g1_i1.p1 TRINITY_DN2050_c2_g1~~TRINITY_DN2050_c2_g1_i1.p1  ORF type:complete len:760 (+),score=198.95 TRINITY_DN2050_c2_g1_i1:156-2435(+)
MPTTEHAADLLCQHGADEGSPDPLRGLWPPQRGEWSEPRTPTGKHGAPPPAGTPGEPCPAPTPAPTPAKSLRGTEQSRTSAPPLLSEDPDRSHSGSHPPDADDKALLQLVGNLALFKAAGNSPTAAIPAGHHASPAHRGPQRDSRPATPPRLLDDASGGALLGETPLRSAPACVDTPGPKAPHPTPVKAGQLGEAAGQRGEVPDNTARRLDTGSPQQKSGSTPPMRSGSSIPPASSEPPPLVPLESGTSPQWDNGSPPPLYHQQPLPQSDFPPSSDVHLPYEQYGQYDSRLHEHIGLGGPPQHHLGGIGLHGGTFPERQQGPDAQRAFAEAVLALGAGGGGSGSALAALAAMTQQRNGGAPRGGGMLPREEMLAEFLALGGQHGAWPGGGDSYGPSTHHPERFDGMPQPQPQHQQQQRQVPHNQHPAERFEGVGSQGHSHSSSSGAPVGSEAHVLAAVAQGRMRDAEAHILAAMAQQQSRDGRQHALLEAQLRNLREGGTLLNGYGAHDAGPKVTDPLGARLQQFGGRPLGVQPGPTTRRRIVVARPVPAGYVPPPGATHVNISTTNLPPSQQQQQQQQQQQNGVSGGRRCGHQVLVKFKRGRVLQYEAPSPINPGEYALVTGDRGEDLGLVVNCWWGQRPDPPAVPLLHHEDTDFGGCGAENPQHQTCIGRVLRIARREEVAHLHHVQAEMERRAVETALDCVREHGLDIDLVDAEYQFDRKKLTFFYKSPCRQDFRKLVRDLWRKYRARIWMEKIED